MNFLSLYKRKLLYKLKKKINIDNNENNPKDLDALFEFYGTDKANVFLKTKDKKGQGFSQFYEKHLVDRKNDLLNILEIGSFAGASAAAFSKYFKNSKIFCLDINISNFKYQSKKIDVFGLDITNSKMVDDFFKKIGKNKTEPFFDIIIDDGSHKLSDMLISFKTFFRNVNANGFYIIEDYKFPNSFNHLKNIDDIMIDDLIDYLNKKKRFESKILNTEYQDFVFSNIKDIFTYEGSKKNSNICFIERK